MKNQVYKLLKLHQLQFLCLWSLITLSVFVFSACEDTFENDITDDAVEQLAPLDEYNFSDPNISFWWNPISGAMAYNLKVIQIDTNSNNALIKLLLDSNLTENQFQMSLNPGSYEWGIVAYNGGYETDYYYRIFHIDSTLDISNTNVRLLFPVDNFATKDVVILFDWSILPKADKYTFQIRKIDENGTPQVTVYDMTSTFVDTTVGVDGIYAWTVFADNNQTGTTSQKIWRNILIDRTAPIAPDLLRPELDSIIVAEDLEDDKIRFSWDKVIDSGSAINKYTLEISEDSLSLSSDYSISVNDTFYLWEPNDVDTMYWRVNVTDTAQNTGDFSNWNWFFLL